MHSMILAFVTSFFNRKLPTDVFMEGPGASAAVVDCITRVLQAPELPPNKTPFAVTKGKPAFAAILKIDMTRVWETLY